VGRGVPLPTEGGCSPLHRGIVSEGAILCFVISKLYILLNSALINLKFFFIIVSSLSGFGSILWQIVDFRAKQ